MPVPRSEPDAIEAAEAIDALPVVEEAGELSPTDGHDRWGVAIVLVEGVGRVPPQVCRTLAEHDLGVGDTEPEGDYRIVIAV